MNPRASANAVVDTIQRVVNVVGASANLVSNVLVNSERLVADVVGDSAAVARESEALYAAAAEGASAVREVVRATPRFSRVVSELLRLVAAYRVHELKARALSPAAASSVSAGAAAAGSRGTRRMYIRNRFRMSST